MRALTSSSQFTGSRPAVGPPAGRSGARKDHGQPPGSEGPKLHHGLPRTGHAAVAGAPEPSGPRPPPPRVPCRASAPSVCEWGPGRGPVLSWTAWLSRPNRHQFQLRAQERSCLPPWVAAIAVPQRHARHRRGGRWCGQCLRHPGMVVSPVRHARGLGEADSWPPARLTLSAATKPSTRGPRGWGRSGEPRPRSARSPVERRVPAPPVAHRRAGRPARPG